MFKKLGSVLLSVGIGVSAANFAIAGESPNTKRNTSRKQPSVELKVVPVGPSQELIEKAKDQVQRSAALQKELRGANYRLVSFEAVETNEKDNSGNASPDNFRAVFYDYTNERTVIAAGSFADPQNASITEDAGKPDSSDEEFELAAQILKQKIAAKGQNISVYRPMPTVTVLEGTTERLINVGIEPLGGSANQVIGVSLKRNEIVRYEKGAPPTSSANASACGIPNAGQQTTARNTQGQAQVTTTFNGTTLWELLVIRPAASSGTRASGVELRDVKYRGKSVLKRGHVPVLNVEYASGSSCGPYRDWQWQEGMFETGTGTTEPAPGIRVLPEGSIATTSVETGNDTGNFRGVAIYRQNNETVLVSEMDAGWYRYIMEWRLADNGTIRPRFGFSAVNNSCVCIVHNHHVYWRLDFDVVNTNNNVYQVERGRKFIKPITTELTMLRSYQTNRSLLIQNAEGVEAYMLVPNISDGKADNYGRSDFWVLRYKTGATNLQSEIDDGYNSSGGSGTAINITQFANGESVVNQDVVVWYGAHFIHSESNTPSFNPDRSGLILTGDHVIGPEIRPIRW